jgi:SAM-dependent methyltransferase
MPTNYDTIAKRIPGIQIAAWRIHTEAYTFFQLLGNLDGLSVLDLACGEGFYTRQIKLRGAQSVHGVDISTEMIRLARESEAKIRSVLNYTVQDVYTLQLDQKFDIVCASYLLNYALTAGELNRMGQVIVRHLKPGGRFVTTIVIRLLLYG